MYQQFPHINFPIGEGHVFSNMFDGVETVARLKLIHIEYYKLLAYIHLKLVVNFAYLKDFDDMDTFNISGVEMGKYS